jgi:hypothetical protein
MGLGIVRCQREGGDARSAYPTITSSNEQPFYLRSRLVLD